jgi:hypothetical protein
MSVARVVVLVVCALTASCENRVRAADAATVGAVAVGATMIYRATTGGCWGQCRGGHVCDPETGTCVELPACGGRCFGDERCEVGPVEEQCVPILGIKVSFVDAASSDANADRDR